MTDIIMKISLNFMVKVFGYNKLRTLTYDIYLLFFFFSQSSKDLLPSEVLRHVLGVGPYIKYSTGTVASQLSKALINATDLPFAVSSLCDHS